MDESSVLWYNLPVWERRENPVYKRNRQGWLKHMDFILLDALVLQVAFVIAYMLRHGWSLPYALDSYRTLAILFAIFDIGAAALFDTMHNVLKRGYYQEAVQSVKQVLLVLTAMTLFLFSVKIGDTFSRITVYTTAVFHLLLGYTSRLAWKPIVRRVGRDRPKTTMILVADERHVPDVLSGVEPTDHFRFTGLVLSNRDAAGETVGGVPVVANLASAADYICREWVDEVFICPAHLSDIEVRKSAAYERMEGLIEDSYGARVKREGQPLSGPEPEEPTVAALIEQCRQMSVPIHIRLPISNLGGKAFVEKVSGFNVLTATANYASPLQLARKRTLDILGGLVGSLIALVIMAIVGPKIKRESPGPILFRQTRIGLNGKKFRIYKIRSMYMDAEERKQELMKENRVDSGMMFKLDWDPRIIGNKIVDGKQVTGIGEYIRSHSLDEFPQFFNVLFNQMSLVGTRPPTVDEWEKYKYHHRARLSAKPGITGLWQVSGRSRITDFEEVVRLDTEYISHWSIGLDLRILLKTIKTVWKKDGAM